MTAAIRRTVTFPGVSIERLKSMLGAYNGHLKQIEQRLDVTISHRGDAFYVDGEMDAVERAEGLLHRLHEEAENTAQISADTLHLMIQGSQTDRELQEDLDGQEHTGLDEVWLQTRKGRINPRVPTKSVMCSVFYKVIFLLVLDLRVQVKPISPLQPQLTC